MPTKEPKGVNPFMILHIGRLYLCAFVVYFGIALLYNTIHSIRLIIWDAVLLTALSAKFNLWLLVRIPMNSDI